METNKNIQVLDASGLNQLVKSIKDGTLPAGKAKSVDAANIEGVLPLNKVPAAALERLFPVADDDARLALTVDDVQNGDTVKVEATGKMYFVKDDTKLGTGNAADAFSEYAVGASAKAAFADAAPWSGITDKPKEFPPESHTHDADEVGVEAIPEATIEAIINGTYTDE